MQVKLGEDPSEKRKELEQKRMEEERWRKERKAAKRYFKENFKYGSTTVLRHDGQFFFWGDISHCGTENIFYNARKIRSMMLKNGHTRGHMSYNDPPTFDSKWSWDREEEQRRSIYRDDLYKFARDDSIIVVELIGTEPVGHVYKDKCVEDSGGAGNAEM